MIDTSPLATILVAKLPDIPELTDAEGRHFDLGFFYSWKIEPANGKTIPGSEKGRFVGYKGDKNALSPSAKVILIASWRLLDGTNYLNCLADCALQK